MKESGLMWTRQKAVEIYKLPLSCDSAKVNPFSKHCKLGIGRKILRTLFKTTPV